MMADELHVPDWLESPKVLESCADDLRDAAEALRAGDLAELDRLLNTVRAVLGPRAVGPRPSALRDSRGDRDGFVPEAEVVPLRRSS